MFSTEAATDLHEKFVAFFEAGKIASALCQGSPILRYAKLSNGECLAQEKTVTGFAIIDEDFADNAVWPINVCRVGANYVRSGLWRAFAGRDGNLITGQRNFSAPRWRRASFGHSANDRMNEALLCRDHLEWIDTSSMRTDASPTLPRWQARQ